MGRISPLCRSRRGVMRCAGSSTARACCSPIPCRGRRRRSPTRFAASVWKESWPSAAIRPTRRARRSDAWVKVRFAKHQEFVIGGYKPNAAHFDSLLVGYYEGRRLMCAGKVRNGFTPLLRAQVFARIDGLQTARCPFANLPSTRTGHWGEGITADEMTALRWLKPVRVAEVSFAEWPRDGSLRHAAFIALRDDKRPRAVVREAAAT